MITLYCAVFVAAARAGGTYDVAECSPGHTGTPDAAVEGSTTDYAASTSCASGNWLQVQSVASTVGWNRKQWSYIAPPGTRIERFRADYSLVGDASPDGNRSYLFVKRYGQSDQENLSVVGLGSTSGTYDSTVQPLGPFASIGVGVFCSKADRHLQARARSVLAPLGGHVSDRGSRAAESARRCWGRGGRRMGRRNDTVIVG